MSPGPLWSKAGRKRQEGGLGVRASCSQKTELWGPTSCRLELTGYPGT